MGRDYGPWDGLWDVIMAHGTDYGTWLWPMGRIMGRDYGLWDGRQKYDERCRHSQISVVSLSEILKKLLTKNAAYCRYSFKILKSYIFPTWQSLQIGRFF